MPEESDFDSDEELDFSDLREQHEVSMEQGLDRFVVIDGLPAVPEDSRQKLVRFLLKKVSTAGGRAKEEDVFMPLNDQQMTEGYAFVELEAVNQAVAVAKTLNETHLDKRHLISVNKLTDIERYGREGRVDEEYTPPTIEPFREKEHKRWYLNDPNCRDQVILFRGDSVGVFWNRKKETPEQIVDRLNWTEGDVGWSPLGTYLFTMHHQGIQMWSGPSWQREARLPHPGCNLIDFSPGENYVTTWSFKPIEVDENHPILSVDENHKNYVIWDLATAKPLRSFANHDVPGGVDERGMPTKKVFPWPAFKWSSDDKYVARMLDGQSLSVYELPKMNLLDRTTIKVEGIKDFEWAPALPQRESVKSYEQLLCYWTPEIGSQPAKVSLMSIPSKEVVRTRNLFNVSDARLHWQSQAAYICVKVDRHSKSKKSLATNLEIFRVREKGVPVEVVDSIKDTVVNFAWEPRGDRFVLITTAPEAALTTTAVPPKTSVSFFCPEKVKGAGVGNFKHIRTFDRKTSNGIYWSPKGRFVVVATVASQQGCDLEFWDLDFEGEKAEADKDLTANLQLMARGDHYGMTDIEWDSTGRYVVSSASMFKLQIEHGYHLYDFKGELLREEHIDKFKRFFWRPRPPSMLSRDAQRQIRRNLREYSRDFEEEDRIADDKEKGAVVEERRRLLSDWLQFQEEAREDEQEERREMGLLDDEKTNGVDGEADGEQPAQVVEELVEEIVDETEEIIS